MRSCVMILTPSLISVNLLDVVLDGGIVLYLIFNDVGVRQIAQKITQLRDKMEDRNGIILWELMMVRQKESISIVCYLHEQGEKFKFAGKNDELYVY